MSHSYDTLSMNLIQRFYLNPRLIYLTIILVIIIIMMLIIWTWYHPESFLIPMNLLYNIDPSPRTNFYSDLERDNIFPVGLELESIWQDIRQECNELYESLPNKDINYLDNYNMNIGDETKRQWTTIPLRLFGYDSIDYMNKCPMTSRILRDHPEIKSCLFSIMEPGKIIKPHVGPYDGLLRYQLALDIPLTRCSQGAVTANEMGPSLMPDEKRYEICTFDTYPTRSGASSTFADSKNPHQNSNYEQINSHSRFLKLGLPAGITSCRLSSLSEESLTILKGSNYEIDDSIYTKNECYLHVGGERYEWIEGKGIMFDEANLHGAVNTTLSKRIVLLIDLERPYSFLPFRLLNKIIIWGMGKLTTLLN